jgi:hypothetical protein
VQLVLAAEGRFVVSLAAEDDDAALPVGAPRRVTAASHTLGRGVCHSLLWRDGKDVAQAQLAVPLESATELTFFSVMRQVHHA